MNRLLIAGVQAEVSARRDSVSLAAFENVLSHTARSVLAVPLADRYLIGRAEDRPSGSSWINGGLMCTGYPGIDLLEAAATEAARGMFGAAWVDFRPLSGLHATICTVTTMTAPGELVYSIDPMEGGHFATRGLLKSTGRASAYLPWRDGTVDLAAFAAQWARWPGRMVLFDHGIPQRAIPVAEIRAVVGPEPRLVYDASHTLGVIAGGAFQDPLAEGCDVLQGNTHKSFPGAHKGLVAFADAAVGREMSDRMGGALVSSQNTGATLANFVTTLELAEHGRAYAAQMLANRAALAGALRAEGGEVREGCTHVLLVAAISGRSGYDLTADLIACGIHLNARPIGGRVLLRLGVQEVTRRGLGSDDLVDLAALISRVARDGRSGRVQADVLALARAFPDVHYSFDEHAGRLEEMPA